MKSVAFIVAAFLLDSAGLGLAESNSVPKDQDLTGIQSRLKEANENIAQIKIDRENLLAQLQSIEKQYGEAAGSLRNLGLEIGGRQQLLKSIEKEMQGLQTQLKLQSNELSKQIKSAFVMGKKEQLRLLLNQQDPALASRMMVYYSYLNKSRLDKLATLKSNLDRLTRLEQQKSRETELLGRAERSHQAVKAGLSKAQKQRELLLAKLNRDFNRKYRQLALLEENASQSQALIDRLQQMALEREKQEAMNPNKVAPDSPGMVNKLDIDGNPVNPNQQKTDKTISSELYVNKAFPELKGQLPWPVKGSIVKRFGSQRAATTWDGILISAHEGADIRAVNSGRVVFADWLRGYGLLIIIDHGKGYMTLYAFNQSLYKKVGEQVKAGTVIAAVGKSGGREAAGLYFGIRNKGKPVDPALWCKKG